MTKLKNTIMLSLFDVNAKIVPVPYKHKGPILKIGRTGILKIELN